MSKQAAQRAYSKAGVKPSDVQVVELHGKHLTNDPMHTYTMTERIVRTSSRKGQQANEASHSDVNGYQRLRYQCTLFLSWSGDVCCQDGRDFREAEMRWRFEETDRPSVIPDCFSANELITYEALGLCDEGNR